MRNLKNNEEFLKEGKYDPPVGWDIDIRLEALKKARYDDAEWKDKMIDLIGDMWKACKKY